MQDTKEAVMRANEIAAKHIMAYLHDCESTKEVPLQAAIGILVRSVILIAFKFLGTGDAVELIRVVLKESAKGVDGFEVYDEKDMREIEALRRTGGRVN